jgi:hypothetical protein
MLMSAVMPHKGRFPKYVRDLAFQGQRAFFGLVELLSYQRPAEKLLGAIIG